MAFTLGFAVLFFLMILLTLLYAPVLPTRTSGWIPTAIAAVPAALLGLHFIIQSAFTVAAHTSMLDESIAERVPWLQGPSGRPREAVLIGLLVVGAGSSLLPTYHGLSISEIIYRLFMSFYGLVFPAYVWLLMIPTRDGHSGLAGPNGRRKLLIWAFAVGLAAPMFWMGFIERQTWWLAPGLGVVLAARLFLPRRSLPARR